jgi:hypothetical protein
MKSFKEYFLTEMPQHYSSAISYMKDDKFTKLSKRNVMEYVLLGAMDGLVYMVDQELTSGFVFDEEDFNNTDNSILPAMRLSLRDTKIDGFKQAHFLRIRQKYSQKNITSTWYNLYVEKFNGIVSDFEHLEGGKQLWKSIIKTATINPNTNVSLIDYDTMDVLISNVTTNTPESDIWSSDSSKKHQVLLYTLKA